MTVFQWTGTFFEGGLRDVGTVAEPNPAAPRILYAGLRSDELWRGAAGDAIRGTAGGDILFLDAGDGLQFIKGIGSFFLGGGNDVIDFTSPTLTYGPIRVSAGAGNDLVLANDGNDAVFGGSGNDRLKGYGGGDTLDGGDGADWLAGGIGQDVLKGGAAADSLSGGGGNDRLFGEAGADQLAGGAGRDRIDGGAGADVCTGGTGADIFVIRGVDSPPGMDLIVDFSRAGGDRIALSDFGASELFARSLPSGFDDPCLIFDDRTGILYADTNGAATGGRSALADLVGVAGLTIDDIIFL